MLQPLPKETVFEARHRLRRRKALLVVFFFLSYFFFFWLLFYGVLVGVGMGKSAAALSAQAAFPLSFLPAVFHFSRARMMKLESLLEEWHANPANPRDQYHKRFLNQVEEVRTACGLDRLEGVVLPSLGVNAFALEDARGRKIIGVTEGLLATLEREELTAVLAHEAAHLSTGDARLLTLVIALTGIFRAIHRFAGRLTWESSSNRGKGSAALIWVALVGAFAHGFLKTVLAALSRNREWEADVLAVRMTKNPLALVGALEKTYASYGGVRGKTFGLEALFFADPTAGPRVDRGGWWSTHPPTGKRVARLLVWAGEERASFLEKEKEKTSEGAPKPKAPSPKESFFVFNNEKWEGPYSLDQLALIGRLNPQDWVCREGENRVHPAAFFPQLALVWTGRLKQKATQKRCPRCHAPLVERFYEGAPGLHCVFCRGWLLEERALQAILARREEVFGKEEFEKLRKWRDAQKGTPWTCCDFPDVNCPDCGERMSKRFHHVTTKVVVDQCRNPSCGRVWLDGGELEAIQILMEEAAAGETPLY